MRSFGFNTQFNSITMTMYATRFSLLMMMLYLPCALMAQNWERDAQDPQATELWVEPPVVTPGQGASAPSDAIVLFDGSNLAAWASTEEGEPIAWTVEDGVLTIAVGSTNLKTKQAFGSVQLHLEFRTPSKEDSEGPTGQGRGNSGIFFMGRYELQILDSYQNRTYGNGQAGAVYKQYPPLVNASRPAEVWQSYDVVFMAPVFGEAGQLLRPATLTAFHNGVLIQNNVSILGPVEYKGLPQYRPHAAKLPLQLQHHGNPVSFRNIWIREL
jgi:hypothetical protein